jgi:hypothetical protein
LFLASAVFFFSSLSIPVALQRRVLGPFPESNSIWSQSLHICYSLPFPPGHIYHTVLPSFLGLPLPLLFTLLALPLPVLVFYNPAFLPHGHTNACVFFLYSLGLVLDLMFL